MKEIGNYRMSSPFKNNTMHFVNKKIFLPLEQYLWNCWSDRLASKHPLPMDSQWWPASLDVAFVVSYNQSVSRLLV